MKIPKTLHPEVFLKCKDVTINNYNTILSISGLGLTSQSEVYGNQILTYEVEPSTNKSTIFIRACRHIMLILKEIQSHL